MIQVVEFDAKNRCAIRVLSDPVEVMNAMYQRRDLMGVSDIDLDQQTIQGIPIVDIYRKSDEA
jgi:hypothetical protein